MVATRSQICKLLQPFYEQYVYETKNVIFDFEKLRYELFGMQTQIKVSEQEAESNLQHSSHNELIVFILVKHLYLVLDEAVKFEMGLFNLDKTELRSHHKAAQKTKA